MVSKEEKDRLIENVDPKAKLPRHFDLFSETMQVMWLKAHQRKDKPIYDRGRPARPPRKG